jgi:hypothetical protein
MKHGFLRFLLLILSSIFENPANPPTTSTWNQRRLFSAARPRNSEVSTEDGICGNRDGSDGWATSAVDMAYPSYPIPKLMQMLAHLSWNYELWGCCGDVGCIMGLKMFDSKT